MNVLLPTVNLFSKLIIHYYTILHFVIKLCRSDIHFFLPKETLLDCYNIFYTNLLTCYYKLIIFSQIIKLLLRMNTLSINDYI